jgi:hypothetical protein
VGHALPDLYHDWEQWATTADQSENGWQSDYPGWQPLMEAASVCMVQCSGDPDCIGVLECCWAISEETEDLATFARDHIKECWDTLQALVVSRNPTVRWQVYSALDAAGERGEALLRQGLADPDLYARRRALLALANVGPHDAKDLVEQYLDHDDPYMRLAAITMANTLGDPDFARHVHERMRHDSAAFVREAARKG